MLQYSTASLKVIVLYVLVLFFQVMISTPQNLGDKIRAGLMEILIDTYHVQGVCMVMQSLLALYSYNATSGIIVDVGERMEILPIFDGEAFLA